MTVKREILLELTAVTTTFRAPSRSSKTKRFLHHLIT
jgi:hypothetical protein